MSIEEYKNQIEQVFIGGGGNHQMIQLDLMTQTNLNFQLEIEC